jgi:hypothetical protein
MRFINRTQGKLMIASNTASGAVHLTDINQNQHDSTEHAFPTRGLLQRFTERISACFTTTESEPENSLMNRIHRLGLGAYMIAIGAALAITCGPIGIGFGVALILIGLYSLKRAADLYSPAPGVGNLTIDPADL